MKKLLFLIVVCFSFSVDAQTKLIIAERKTDAIEGVYVSVSIWGKADGSVIQRKVTAAAFITKLSALTNKTITGFLKNTDRIMIWFNADGSLNRIDCHVVTTNDTESLQTITIDKSKLSSQTITDAGILRLATEALP